MDTLSATRASTPLSQTSRTAKSEKKNKWARGFASLFEDTVEPSKTLASTISFQAMKPGSSTDIDCPASPSAVHDTVTSLAPSIDLDGSMSADLATLPPESEYSTALEPSVVCRDVKMVSKPEVSYGGAGSDSDDRGMGGIHTILRPEWVGTSQFNVDDNVATQKNGHLDSLINWRQALVHDMKLTPYDPFLYLDLNLVDYKLGFTDIAVSDAHRAMILIYAARKITDNPRSIRTAVRNAITKRLQSNRRIILDDELKHLLLQAQQALAKALFGCAAYRDGSIEAEKALKSFPGDKQLLKLEGSLKTALLNQQNGLLKLGAKGEDLVLRAQIGKLFQKSYPWMEKGLFMRKPALIREVNKSFAAGSCEVRPVIFGPPLTIPRVPREDGDVGALGIFATRDIKRGELVMVDQSITGISDVPSSKLQHCDACHASLNFPFLRPDEIIRPTCCKRVAYCSRSCYETASKGYHNILCGKDFDWLYNDSATQAGVGHEWTPIMFLRLVSIIIADRRTQAKAGKKPVHPLAHPLMSRMSANYSSSKKLQPDLPSDWQFFENVVAPTRILIMLGVNIFTDLDFSQETIQTMYWRVDNNASMSTVNLSLSAPRRQKSNHLPLQTQGGKNDEGKVSMKCINPSYLFFNHSCEPNVSWHGAVPDPWAGIEWLMGYGGEILRPGCSAVFCTAARDIVKGEEMKISYVGDATGDDDSAEDKDKDAELCGRAGKRLWLRKWFEGGCGCDVCLRENLTKRERKEKSSEVTRG